MSTLFQFDFDFVRQRYDFELQRKEQLSEALTLPTGVLSLLGGAAVAMIQGFHSSETLLSATFWVLIALAAAGFLACAALLGYSYHIQTYVYLPLLGDIDKSQSEFLAFAPVMAGGEHEVMEAFERQMRHRVIAAADQNCQRNDERSALLARARIALFATVILCGLATIPLVASRLGRTEPMPTPPNAPTDQTPSAQVPPAPSTQPQLPTVPPNREIRETEVPRRR